MRETQFNVASPMHYDAMHSLSQQRLLFFLILFLHSLSLDVLRRTDPLLCSTIERQGKVGRMRECARHRGLSKRVEDEGGGRGRTSSRVAVHLSLISRGIPSSPRLSTAKPPGSRASGWERGGYGRNARVFAKHDLFYRSLRAASIIPGRSAGSYLPSPVSRTGPDTGVWTRKGGGLSDGGSTGTGLWASRPPLGSKRRATGSRVSKSYKDTLLLCVILTFSDIIYIAIYVKKY